MKTSTAQSFITAVKYLRESVFSPSSTLLFLMILGFIPTTLWFVVLIFVIPVLDGATKGIVNSMQKALDEVIVENNLPY